MPYINADGSVTDQQNRRSVGFLKSIFGGIVGFVNLFLSSITGNPANIQVTDRSRGRGSSSSSSTGRSSGNARGNARNGARGSNIRGMKNLGTTTTAPAAGGG